MIEGFLKGASGNLAFLEWPGPGTPIVMLHGAAGNGLVWKELAEERSGHHWVALDLPGHGKSDAFSSMQIEELADGILQACQRKWGSPLILGGHSWGGKLAGLMAARHPHGVKKLLLVDPSPSHRLRVQTEGMVERMFGAELGNWEDTEQAIHAVKNLVQYRPWSRGMEEIFKRNLRSLPNGRMENGVSRGLLEEIIQQAILLDCSAALLKVKIPVLLLVASESEHWQKTTNQMVFPGADYQVVQGHHWIHLEKPRDVSERIENFLKTNSG